MHHKHERTTKSKHDRSKNYHQNLSSKQRKNDNWIYLLTNYFVKLYHPISLQRILTSNTKLRKQEMGTRLRTGIMICYFQTKQEKIYTKGEKKTLKLKGILERTQQLKLS